MTKFEKANDLYLRGFNSKYIKTRTGVSTQSLLKTKLSEGVSYTKDDIVNYQVSYISKKYSVDEIIEGYKLIMSSHKDPNSQRRGKHLLALGCAFGEYPRVFKKLLGETEYINLKNKLWHEKMTATVQSKYGVTNVFEKSVFADFVSEDAVERGRDKRHDTMLDRYGVQEPLQNKDILNKALSTMRKTNMSKYGVEYSSQRPDVADKIKESRQKTMLAKYGVKNTVESQILKNKIFDARRKNKTLNTSLPESVMGDILREIFGPDDVVFNQIIDSRYPYHVDYYIKSRDLFIELNGDRCHNEHWFDKNNVRDAQILKSWTNNAEMLRNQNHKKSRYENYIKTWTKSDLDKRSSASKNHLNYLVFWDGSSKLKNKVRYPVLSDFYNWIDAGCPDSNKWLAENTY